MVRRTEVENDLVIDDEKGGRGKKETKMGKESGNWKGRRRGKEVRQVQEWSGRGMGKRTEM